MNALHHGKVKTVWETEDQWKILIEHHDKVTAHNGLKKDFPEGKGAICCTISSFLFRALEDAGVETHFLDQPEPNKMLCKKVNIVPLEVIVRNYSAGSLCRETHIVEGLPLHPPLVEFYLKDDSMNDPLLTKDRMERMGHSEILYGLLTSTALRVNEILRGIFDEVELNLVDFKLEFGHESQFGHLLLADEISPDSMRLWKKGTNERFDKDLFRDEHYVDEGDIIPAYQTILDKLQYLYKE